MDKVIKRDIINYYINNNINNYVLYTNSEYINYSTNFNIKIKYIHDIEDIEIKNTNIIYIGRDEILKKLPDSIISCYILYLDSYVRLENILNNTLIYLSLKRYNYKILKFPDYLKYFIVKYIYNSDIYENVLPDYLKYLVFYRNKKINRFPKQLIYLRYEHVFGINQNDLPNSLKYLIFSGDYLIDIKNIVLNNLKYLEFSSTISNNTYFNILPNQLKTLINKSRHVDVKNFPRYLKKLVFNNNNNFIKDLSVLTPYLLECDLNINNTINLPNYLLNVRLLDITNNQLPKYIKTLDILRITNYNILYNLKYLKNLSLYVINQLQIPETINTLLIHYIVSFNGYLLPKYLKKLYLDSVELNYILSLIIFPKYLNNLILKNFNKDIEINLLPKYLNRLRLINFNKNLSVGVIPKYLKILQLGDELSSDFNKDIEENVLPKYLKYLKLGNEFNKKIKTNTLPKKLKYLSLGDDYYQTIEKNVLPDSIIYLKLGKRFKQKLTKEILPKSLKYLYLSNEYAYKYKLEKFNIPLIVYY